MMSHSKESSSRPELLFLDYDIDDLKGPSLPTNGDMLRYYFNRRHALPKKSTGEIVNMVLDKCIKIWKDNGIPTTKKSNAIRSLEKIIQEFNDMKTTYESANEMQRQEMMTMWRRKYELMYSIATLDAHEKCSVENREKLLAAKKEIRKFAQAVRNGTLISDQKKITSAQKSSSVGKVDKASVSNDNNNNYVNESLEKKKAKNTLRPLETIEISSTLESASRSDDDMFDDNKAEGKMNDMDCKQLRSGRMIYSEVKLKPKKPSNTDDKNKIDLMNQKKSDLKSVKNAKAKPKALKQWHDDQLPFYSPNQNLREQLKQQGWVYAKKNPAWKLAIVAPPSKFID